MIAPEIHEAGRFRRRSGRSFSPRRRFRRALHRACEIPPSLHGVNIALRKKLRIGVLHCDNAHLHVLCKAALGGQALIGYELARKDVRTDAAVKRDIKRRSGCGRKGIGQHDISSGIIIFDLFGYFNNTSFCVSLQQRRGNTQGAAHIICNEMRGFLQ